MTRIAGFTSPLLLGFEEIERLAEKMQRSTNDGYPPYNIEKIGSEGSFKIRITLAVAGFSQDDLDITVENNQLMIRGAQAQDTSRTYLHRGIAARQFQKNFILAEGIEIEGADLENGLLSIDLNRPQPKPGGQKIRINRID
jgi:HSP20 family molecular chaperone IbpA